MHIINEISNICLYIAIFGGPVALLIAFFVSLIRFIRAPKDDPKLRKDRRFTFLLTSVMMGVILFSILFLVVYYSTTNITFM